jgi:CRP-like cAMP-binding protein
VVAGAVLPACALASGRRIVRAPGAGPATEARLALLRSNELFSPLPLTALDRLAEGMAPCSFAPGEAVVRKGDAGDCYVLIADGRVDVTDDGRLLATLGPGDGVGEIALLRDVPRTATATAATDVEAYTIGAPAFLEAVAGPAAAAAAEAVIATRLERSRGLG